MPVVSTPNPTLLETLASVTNGLIVIFFLVQAPLVANRFPKRPKTCLLLVTLTSLLLVLWIWGTADHFNFFLTCWFYVVALVALFLGSIISSNSHKSLEWENLSILFFSGLVVWFATMFYGRIKPGFGGGSPAPVELMLRGEKDGEVKNINALLIDETEQGYYIVDQLTDHKALFIPRGEIRQLRFSHGDVEARPPIPIPATAKPPAQKAGPGPAASHHKATAY